MGHRRDDITEDDVRFWQIYSYMIVYNIDEDYIEIARVLSHYRDIASIL